jgi:hypothetical protein
MAKPKSIIQRIEVDRALKAHDCQHDKTHRIQRGDKRLKVWKDRTPEHYCVPCALKIIAADIAKLQNIDRDLRG